MSAARALADLFGAIGRSALSSPRPLRAMLEHTSGIWSLFLTTLHFSVTGWWRRDVRLREQLFPMMSNVGLRSFPIVALISFLLGAILVLQTGEPLKRYGQIQEAPGAVALSLTREIAPLLTSIVMTARVGASFTAVLGSMRINDEVLALETMAIHPVGYLVAPRVLSLLVMLPCLTLMACLIGMFGGALVAVSVYDLSTQVYIDKTVFYLTLKDMISGLVKSAGFSVLISLTCCYFGLIVDGGPMGVGRNIMVAVVASLVLVILGDALATAFINNYVL